MVGYKILKSGKSINDGIDGWLEIGKKLKNLVLEKNVVLMPLSIYFSGCLVKVELAVCTPKRKYDKREAKKEQEVKREIERKFKIR